MSQGPSIPDYWQVVFNTPLECGLRSATVLLASFPKPCDIQRLVQYDYLLVHSGDVDGGPASLHPATPHRSGELLVRRPLIEAGLNFMIQRSVIDRLYVDQGIGYIAGEYAVMFLESLTSDYAKGLRERARWVISRFHDIPDSELGAYMKARWSRWGAEFIRSELLDEAAE